MSAPTDDDQFIRATTEELLVIRGAINVLRELAAQPGVEPEVAVPLDSGRERTYEIVLDELDAEIGSAEQIEADEIRVGFTPAGAQAVRDAVGVLGTLLQDPGGRGLLAEIGFLPDPNAPVDPTEFEQLEDIADRLEPTGARPGAGEPSPQAANGGRPPAREGSEVIDPTLPLDEVIINAAQEIGQATLPWPGFEQAIFALDDSVRTFGGGNTSLSCDNVLKDVVAITKLAVQGKRRAADADVDTWGQFVPRVDDAYTAVLSSIETNHCVGRNAQATLDARFDDVLAALRDEVRRPGDEPPDVTDEAQQLLVDLRSVSEDPVDFRIQEGHDAQLDRIDQLREELSEVLDFALSADTVQDNILSALPPSTASCEQLLVSLAELAQLTAQVVAQTGLSADTGLLAPVNNARRQVLDKLGFENVVVDEPIPGPTRSCLSQEDLSDLRSSLVSIYDPLDDDPGDVEDRAYAAISDVRRAFLRAS